MANTESNETTDLVIDEEKNTIQLRTFNEVWRLSGLLIKSGLFGTKNKAEVATKIVTGLEIGIDPVRAVRHIDTIDGKPSVSAQLSAAMLRMHPHYDYRVDGVNMDGAKVTITYDGEDIGSATFTWEEAQEAGLHKKNNWQNYRRDMLFARAVKRAKKWHAPDVGFGREYMPDELGEDESPTVSVPEEVIEEGKEASKETSPPTKSQDEVEEVDYEVVDEDESTGESDSSESEGDTSSTDFDMHVEDTDYAKSEVEDDSEVDTRERGKLHKGKRSEPRAIPGGIEGVEGKLNEIEYELDEKKDDPEKLERALDALWNYHEHCKEGEFRDQLGKTLRHYEKILKKKTASLEDLKGPTQNIIEEIDDNLSKLEGEKLERQISNYKSECSEWSQPAKRIAFDVIKEHEKRLNEDAVSEEQMSDTKTRMKERAAEWESNLSTAQTMLGMKVKETIHLDPLQNLKSKLSQKARNFIEKTREEFGDDVDLAENMEDQWHKIVRPYAVIENLRGAIVESDTINYDHFDDTLDEYTKELKSWDDKEKAKKAHDIVSNEVERLVEKVDDFNVHLEE